MARQIDALGSLSMMSEIQKGKQITNGLLKGQKVESVGWVYGSTGLQVV